MYRTYVILVILSLVLSACSPASISIWGVAQTPTPDSLNPVAAPQGFDPFVVQDSPIIFPTSTTPPQIETEAAYTLTATPNGISPKVELTTAATALPSFDTAPFLYYAQSGDMLSAVASRFGVKESEIT
jgi:hypothetical protein